MFNWAQVQGIIRHVLTFAGGYVVAAGWFDQETVNQLVGAVMTILGAVWSFKAKEKKDAE